MRTGEVVREEKLEALSSKSEANSKSQIANLKQIQNKKGKKDTDEKRMTKQAKMGVNDCRGLRGVVESIL